MDHAYPSRSDAQSEPSIATIEGLKKETGTAIIQYFAPVVALYNVVAQTAGFPVVKWPLRTYQAEKDN
jgi:hypothetical protein